MNKVVIRTDASVWIGTGHVMRCIVLADCLRENGFDVSFACLPQRGNLIAYIASLGFHVYELSLKENLVEPSFIASYQAWLQRTQKEDAKDFLAYIDDASWVVCDHYALDEEWQRLVKLKLGCRILCIDDLVRKHAADVIVDQTLGRTSGEYESSGLVLAGSQYALLNTQFSKLHASAKYRNPPALSFPKILITMGGIDPPNATIKVLQSLVPNVNANFTVLLSARSPHFYAVKEWCQKYDNVQHIEFTENMADIMLEHDIAIGAPGSTSWERACLGLPSIVISLADNQIEICQRLVKYGVALEVKLEKIDTVLYDTYQNLLNNWESIHKASLNASDGRGTQRVVEELVKLEYEYSNSL